MRFTKMTAFLTTMKSKSISRPGKLLVQIILLGISPPFHHEIADELFISGISPSLRGYCDVFVPHTPTPKKTPRN